MAKKEIYRITITNFNKYNSSLKKGHKAILISTGFLSDSKIRMLNPSSKLLFLSCLLVSGESTSSQIEVSHDSLCFQSGVKSGSLQSQLDLLQELQLLSYEKIGSLYNRIEKNIIEKKRKELTVGSKTPTVPVEKTNTELNRKIWSSYEDAYKLRYGLDPVRNAKINGLISQLGKRLGESAIDVVRFYLSHNDKFYILKTHSLEYCVKDAESLHLQWQKGHALTAKDAKNIEEKSIMAKTWDDIERGNF